MSKGQFNDMQNQRKMIIHNDPSIERMVKRCRVEYNGQLIGMFQSIHKSWYFKLGGMNENYIEWGGEEQEFHHRLVKAGVKTIVCKKLYALHMWHPTRKYNAYNLRMQKSISKDYPIVQNVGREWGKIR
jgi:predicted glycosyltransferase involved in capsule biosynthesis